MSKMEASAPGRCQLHMFDPSVVRLPPQHPPWIVSGNYSFEQLALSHTTQYLTHEVTKDAAPFNVQNAARSTESAKHRVTWNQTTLRHLLDRDGLKKANILKIDIENAEFAVFLKNACLDPVGLPFDQLLIELHYGPPGFTPEQGPRLYPKESGRDIIEIFECLEANGFVIFSREPNVNACACNHRPLWTYEYSFVRRDSLFAQAVTPQGLALGRQGGGGEEAWTSPWTEVLAWQEKMYLQAVDQRRAMVLKYAEVAGDAGADSVRAWSSLPCWHCRSYNGVPPFYIWDLFEPRYPCPSRRFGEGGSLRCLHDSRSGSDASPKFKQIKALTQAAWNEHVDACTNHDLALIGMDEIVVSARILNSGTIDPKRPRETGAGRGADLAALVGCLEHHGFRSNHTRKRVCIHTYVH